MRKTLSIFLLILLLTGCKKDAPKLGEVSAEILGFIVEDSFTGQLTCSGYDVKIREKHYRAIGEMPEAFSDPNAWPASVWIRYRRDNVDPCTRRSNRIVLLSVRKR